MFFVFINTSFIIIWLLLENYSVVYIYNSNIYTDETNPAEDTNMTGKMYLTLLVYNTNILNTYIILLILFFYKNNNMRVGIVMSRNKKLKYAYIL